MRICEVSDGRFDAVPSSCAAWPADRMDQRACANDYIEKHGEEAPILAIRTRKLAWPFQQQPRFLD